MRSKLIKGKEWLVNDLFIPNSNRMGAVFLLGLLCVSCYACASASKNNSAHISYLVERELGKSVAINVMQQWGLPVKNRSIQSYVNFVGHAVAMHSRQPHPNYRFSILDNPKPYVVSVPGGIILMTSGLFSELANEAQLAAILAYQIALINEGVLMRSVIGSPDSDRLASIDVKNINEAQQSALTAAADKMNKVLMTEPLDISHNQPAWQSAIETLYRTGYYPGSLLQVAPYLSTEDASKYRHAMEDQLHSYGDIDELPVITERFKKYSRRIMKPE